jgi:hypothetical protein
LIADGVTTDVEVRLDPQPAGSLAGVVTSGGGLPGVRIELAETPLVTNSGSDGAYSFASVPEDVYVVSASLFGFGASTALVNIHGGVNTKNFALVPSPVVRTLEADPGWTVGAAGDNATGGIWTRVEPLGTYLGGDLPIQPETDHTTDPGELCFVTGQGMFPGAVGEADVDNGRTTLLSAIYNLSAVAQATVRFHRWYVNNGNPSVDDVFRVDVSSNAGTTWANLETLATTRRFWEPLDFYLPDYITVTSQVRFRFVAEDQGIASVVEAGIDDFEIYGLQQTTGLPEAATDLAPALMAPAPNPLDRPGVLRFQLPSAGDVSLDIVDSAGRRVIELLRGRLGSGAHALVWDTRDASGKLLPAGVYFQRLRFGTARMQASKLVIVR